MAQTRLSPPWFTIRNQLFYTIGQSPFVKVSELIEDGEGLYKLNIYVKSEYIARCIRAIVPVIYELGNVTLTTVVIVECSEEIIEPINREYENVEEVASLFCCALRDNPLFAGVVINQNTASEGNIIVVIRKSVIQFFNDDISDYCNNYNEVAADVFAQVLVREFALNVNVSFTTCSPNCIPLEDFYCKGIFGNCR